MTTELTAKALKDWVADHDDYYSIGELGDYNCETPWGETKLVPGTWYAHGDGHETGFVIDLAGKFFHISGVYSSWDSTEYDNVLEVLPAPITVTRYVTLDGSILKEPTL